jgi:Ca2+-binding EF-hand superfamily protein
MCALFYQQSISFSLGSSAHDLYILRGPQVMSELDLHSHEDEQLVDDNHGDQDQHIPAISLARFLDKMELFQKEQIADTERCAALFKLFDNDNSGQLEEDEVKLMLEHLGLAELIADDSKFVVKMIQEIESTRALDDEQEGAEGLEKERDGWVTYDEFLPWFMQTGRSYLPRHEYNVEVSNVFDLDRKQLRELFDRIDSDGSGSVDLIETYTTAHSVWPLLGREQCAIAFHAVDADGTGHIDFKEFETLVHCLAYLNKNRHTVRDCVEHLEVVSEDEFQIACNLLHVQLNGDLEATACFWAEAESLASAGKLLFRHPDRLTGGQFIEWVLRHEVCDRLQLDQRLAWMAAELSQHASANQQGKVFFEDLAETVHKSQGRSTAAADTRFGRSLLQMKTVLAESADRKHYLELGFEQALGRIDSLPNLTP